MRVWLSHVFHKASKDLSLGHPSIPRDTQKYPDKWRDIFYKKYKRFKNISLPPSPKESKYDFFTLVKKRRSQRVFTGKEISLKEISVLLKYSCGLFKEGDIYHRAQPSAGARYPLEVYIAVYKGNDVGRGIYHYDVLNHSLVNIFSDEQSLKDIKNAFGDEWTKNASLVFFVTALFDRNQNKYGERGYRHILLEAGHVGQNVSLLAEELEIHCAISSYSNDVSLEKVLGLDGVTESVVYTLFLG